VDATGAVIERLVRSLLFHSGARRRLSAIGLPLGNRSLETAMRHLQLNKFSPAIIARQAGRQAPLVIARCGMDRRDHLIVTEGRFPALLRIAASGDAINRRRRDQRSQFRTPP
jgi:hypothetical protein